MVEGGEGRMWVGGRLSREENEVEGRRREKMGGGGRRRAWKGEGREREKNNGA